MTGKPFGFTASSQYSLKTCTCGLTIGHITQANGHGRARRLNVLRIPSLSEPLTGDSAMLYSVRNMAHGDVECIGCGKVHKWRAKGGEPDTL